MRQLGVSYRTAWLVHHKIMCAMAEREDAHQLINVVQMDDAYLGGELSGGTAGRGSENKVPFVAAVSLNEMGHPVDVKLTKAAGFTLDAIKEWASLHLAPGTVVTSDGLGCFAAVSDAGCVHMPTVVGYRMPRDLPKFAWVNTVLGHLKTTLAGAHHAFDYRRYAAHYLAALAVKDRVLEHGVQPLPNALQSFRNAVTVQVSGALVRPNGCQRDKPIRRLDAVDRRVPDRRRHVVLKGGYPVRLVQLCSPRLDHALVIVTGGAGQRAGLSRSLGLLDFNLLPLRRLARVAMVDWVDSLAQQLARLMRVGACGVDAFSGLLETATDHSA